MVTTKISSSYLEDTHLDSIFCEIHAKVENTLNHKRIMKYWYTSADRVIHEVLCLRILRTYIEQFEVSPPSLHYSSSWLNHNATGNLSGSVGCSTGFLTILNRRAWTDGNEIFSQYWLKSRSSPWMSGFMFTMPEGLK